MITPRAAVLELAGRLRGFRREAEDLARAERLTLWIRWLAIASWIWLIQGAPEAAPAVLVYGVWAGSLLYAAACEVVVRSRPPSALTSIVTILGDTVAVAAMCAVTGGIESPVFPVFYLSVLATGIRFGMIEAFAVAALNVGHAAILRTAIEGRELVSFAFAEGVYFMGFVALIGGLLSREARRQHALALREKERASLLLALTREVGSASDLEDLLSRILAETLRAVPSRGGAIVLRDARGGEPERIVAAGEAPAFGGDAARSVLDASIVRDAKAPVALCGQESVRGALPHAFAGAGVPQSLALVPIRAGSSEAVLLLVDEDRSGRFEPEALDLLGAVAGEASIAIEKARLVADLRDAEARRRSLLRQVIDAEERERRRIAGELHDRMGKRFFEFYYDLRQCQAIVGGRDPAADDLFARLGRNARECSAEIRAMMNELRPTVLDDFGFVEVLKEFVAGIEASGDFAVTLEIDEGAPAAGAEASLALFRVLQEAVLNARKHADARRLWIEYSRAPGGGVRLSVRDDGVGFDAAEARRGHFGLLYMRERAETCGGKMRVHAAPEEGTTIEVVVPEAA